MFDRILGVNIFLGKMVSISKTQRTLNYQPFLPETSYETLLWGFIAILLRLLIDTLFIPPIMWRKQMGNTSQQGFEMLVWESGEVPLMLMSLSFLKYQPWALSHQGNFSNLECSLPAFPHYPLTWPLGEPWVTSCPVNLWLNFRFCKNLNWGVWWERLWGRGLPGREAEGRWGSHSSCIGGWGAQQANAWWFRR